MVIYKTNKQKRWNFSTVTGKYKTRKPTGVPCSCGGFEVAPRVPHG
ncbi:mCG1048777 [Mus musculus]|nr:mCG1048777 [Mus musculus]